MAPTTNRCFRNCWSGICSAGLAIFIMWIILITARTPKFSLLDLSLPIQDNDSTITFKLKFHNTNLGIGVFYSNLTTSFHHYPSNSSSPFAGVVVPGFHQGARKKAVKIGTGETRDFNWTVVNGTTGLRQVRVRVDGSVRFKYIWWKYKKMRSVSVEGAAGLDGQGVFEYEKGLRLYKSDGGEKCFECLVLLAVVIVSNFGFGGG